MAKVTAGEIVSGIIATLGYALKKPIEELFAKFFDLVLVKFHRLKKSAYESKKIRKEIDDLCNQTLAAYGFDRVTVAQFDKYKTIPVTVEEYAKMEATITNEAKRPQFLGVIEDCRDVPCLPFAEDLMALQNNPDGWIKTPDAGRDKQANRKSVRVQNLYNIKKSYRIKLNDHVVNGVLNCIYMREGLLEDLTPDEIDDIKNIAYKIYLLKTKKK